MKYIREYEELIGERSQDGNVVVDDITHKHGGLEMVLLSDSGIIKVQIDGNPKEVLQRFGIKYKILNKIKDIEDFFNICKLEGITDVYKVGEKFMFNQGAMSGLNIDNVLRRYGYYINPRGSYGIG